MRGNPAARVLRLTAAAPMVWRRYCAGFAQPWERWPLAQRSALLLASLGVVWLGAARLGAAVDVSGSEARQRALALLEQNVQAAQQQAHSLPALRRHARELGAGETPDAVPDNSALLHIISAAVDRSGVSLDLFEPGAVNQVASADGSAVVDEMSLHLRTTGPYPRLVGFAEALAALALPVIPSEARLSRLDSGQVSMDVTLRIIGAPSEDNQLSESNMENLVRPNLVLDDPFGAAVVGTGIKPSAALADQVESAAAGTLAGSFQMRSRQAVLLHQGTVWQLLSLPLQESVAAAGASVGRERGSAASAAHSQAGEPRP